MRFDLVVNTFVKDTLKSGAMRLVYGGEMWRPLVDVRDAARAYIAVLEADADRVRNQVFNVSAGNFRISELALRVREALRSLDIDAEIIADFASSPLRDLAETCQARGAVFVHISTDYVFDGARGRYIEADPPQPINTYGASKLAGECLALASCQRTYIFRCASLFGRGGSKQKGGNFVDGILARVLQLQLPFGRYHLVNEGRASWWDLARAALDAAGIDAVVEARQHDPAAEGLRRPRDLSLVTARLAAAGITLPPWQDALKRYLAT